MLIRVADLRLHKLEFKQDFQPGDIEFGLDFSQLGPLHTAGRAEVIVEHRGHKQDVDDIRVVGKVEASLEVGCARCLEAVQFTVNRAFDLLYRPLGVDRRAEEVAISEADTEIGYYDGDALLLEDVLREQLLLASPVKLVCREDCKGLCPQCGANLNNETCNCQQPGDSRWAALSELKNKLQS
ncbi:MAG TPA: DUF177 domain-containing protein [Candidatus Angelobacter sp.]|jgi:uncharacterized protein|nr:DUF177 domain-containing protein [Candidatus Angelobacter sp.]